MPTVAYVQGAEKMLTIVRLVDGGIIVHFADDREGFIPLGELNIASPPRDVSLPNPYTVQVHLTNGCIEEVPWDFARHFAEKGYRERSERVAVQGRWHLGDRVRKLRTEAGLSQEDLAAKSGLLGVTIDRIEAGALSPHFEVLEAMAEGLGLPKEKLLLD